jgi:hypothetical protein
MRYATILILLVVSAVYGTAFAQTQSPPRSAQKPDADRLGMTCAQILKMSSMEWILYFGQKTHLDALNSPYDILRANAAYGKCYDARTDALAASLARSGKGPSKAARADFAGFEAALRDFAAKALVASQPTADSQSASYADLYEKQFRYLFYQEYEAKTVKAAKPISPAAKSPASAAAAGAAPPPAAPAAGPPKPATAEEQARSNADPVTMAKNRFGKLLEVLPDDKMHELHRAFGDVIGPHSISEPVRLAVYRYAIFILEPPSAKPFAPPPF